MRNSSRLKKKGMESEVLTVSALALIVIIIIAIAIFKFFDNAKEKLEIQDCRNSIGAHALLAETSQREIFTDIKCQTRELTIDAKKHDTAKKQIAEDMRRCWYEWLKGDGQLFKGEGIFCHVCSIYDFKQKNQKIDGFQNFLMTESIAIRSVYPEDKKKITYMEYFRNYETTDTDEIEKYPNRTEFKETMIIDTSKKYATIFVYASGKEDIQKYMEGGYRTTALVGGGAIAGIGGIALLVGIGPPGWIIGGILIGGAIVWQALTFEEPQWMAVVQFMEYNSTQISNLGCQYLQANQVSNSQP